jgi:ribosomal protein L11 methyltransferase
VRQVSITLALDGLDADAVEAACFAAGALSLSYTDQRDDAILEPAPGEFRLWPATRLQALFDAERVDPAFLAALAAQIGCDVARLEVAALAERAWEREWLRDFVPLRCGENLWICPSHHDVDAPGAIIVKLDPGLAFGTGTHPTTRLCLEHLDAAPPRDGIVVDYGCGSGILAIAALALGARSALAHDIDPQALVATHDNAVRNGVESKLETVAEADALDARAAGRADLVLANILSGPLCALAPRLVRLLKPGGELVLAGLLAEQEEEVIAAYAPWLTLQRSAVREGWVVLAGRTPDPTLLERKPLRSRQRPRGLLAVVTLLALGLLLQIAHRERAALTSAPVIGTAIAQLYAALGRPIEPTWDVRAYAVRQLGAATDERPGFFTVRASLRNAATRAQPAPLLRLRLLDLDGRTVAQRDLLPREYASNDATLLAPGRRIEAELSALDPGPRVVGFEIDACLPRADRAPVCSADTVASGARVP